MSEIFDENNMRQVLGKYIPGGESLVAGIHAISKETLITGIFGKCIRREEGLFPDEKGGTIELNKRKYGAYDIYLGITQSCQVIAECEKCSYLYQFNDNPAVEGREVQEVASGLLFDDMGTCYSFGDIRSCEMKKGWMGSVKCRVVMKNGGYFKLVLPKLGGVGRGMPHHGEYRDMIMARLGGRNV